MEPITGEEKALALAFLNTAEDYLRDGYRIPHPTLDNHETVDIHETVNSLDEIAQEVHSCSSCILASTRNNAVGGEGNPHPLVLVVGEGPGAEEDRTGRPFVGPAGQLLDRMLAAIDLSRQTNCFIANVVKCRPPNNRDPAPEEITACAPFLARQLALLRPLLILTVGRIPTQALLRTTEGIGRLRGRFFEYQGYPLFPTYHPSALLRDPSLKRPAWEDLKILRAKLDELMESQNS